VTMSFLGGGGGGGGSTSFSENEGDFETGCHRQELPQSAIVSMYSLPDVTRAAGCDADRTRNWMTREGGARAAFLDARESAPDSSSLLCTWRQHGIISALRQWLETAEAKEGNKWAAVVCKALSLALSGFRFSSSIFAKLHPHHSLPPEEIIRQFSACGSAWSKSKVRAIDWHPHTLKLAVASMDDVLRVFYGGSAADNALVPTLKHPRQKNVSCVKWRPLSASGLAVAAQDCVVLWKVDPNSLSSRPSSSCVSFLTLSGHRPVTSLAWAKDGLTLFSASPCDNRVVAWDVTRADGVPTPLVAITGGGVTLLSFSPSGKLLLTATPSAEFRIWNSASDWSNEKWRNLIGRLRASAWSPDGATLLFATEAEAVVYAIDFKTNWEKAGGGGGGEKKGVETAGEARAVLDLSQMEFSDATSEMCFRGGSVHQLEWDPSGERLAVSFQPQSGHAGAVALFATRFQSSTSGISVVDFLPAGVVRGVDSAEEPYAATVRFCPKFPPGSEPPWSPGALLAVAWAGSGRISYHPLHFIPSLASSASVMNSSLATSKLLPAAAASSSHNVTLPNPVYSNDTLSKNLLLNNTLSNNSFYASFNATSSSKSQLFSVAD